MVLGTQTGVSSQGRTSWNYLDLLDEMLLRLYYLYEKSPKKCAELETIVDDLKEAFHINDEGAGIRPVRACGTRW